LAAEIQKRNNEFQLNNSSVEREPVGRLNHNTGKLEYNSVSFILNPLVCFAICGDQVGQRYFAPFPEGLIGGGQTFNLKNALQAIRTILNADPLLVLSDILLDRKSKSTLYFSLRLQNTVISKMQAEFYTLWKPLELWMTERLQKELPTQKDKDGARVPAASSRAVPDHPLVPAAPAAADQQKPVNESRKGGDDRDSEKRTEARDTGPAITEKAGAAAVTSERYAPTTTPSLPPSAAAGAAPRELPTRATFTSVASGHVRKR
jgi:hypothetical protein